MENVSPTNDKLIALRLEIRAELWEKFGECEEQITPEYCYSVGQDLIELIQKRLAE